MGNQAHLNHVLRCTLAWISLFCCSCAEVVSDVTRFNKIDEKLVNPSYVIIPLNSQVASAEFEVYAGSISSRLKNYGFTRVSNPSSADYALFMDYGVSGSRTITGEIPIYGQKGGGTVYHSGTVIGAGGYSSFAGTSYVPPTFGITGSVPFSKKEFDRFFSLIMIDLRKSTPGNVVPAYEATVSSSGTGSQFAMVSECIFDAVFSNFLSSGSETVEIDADRCIQ